MAYAGGNTHLTSQQDAHLAAGNTFAGVSGGHVALFAQHGPIKAIAANGPLSLQAHAGPLELLADQGVTVTATDERIDVLAKSKIVLQAGQTQITLEGGDITFACPGNFTVKAGEVPFKGGSSDAPPMPHLPMDLATLAPNEMLLEYVHATGDGVQGAPYEVTFADGSKRTGKLDSEGFARLVDVPRGVVQRFWGCPPSRFRERSRLSKISRGTRTLPNLRSKAPNLEPVQSSLVK